jgi:polysaccharide chain length determinant protein (PEP-CTERM system associated)
MANEYPPSYPSHDDSQGRRLDPELALEIWHRRKWLALLVASAVLAGAVAMAIGLPDLYRASAKVLIDHQDVSESFVRPSVTSELETRIQTIHQQITSRARLGNLIDSLKLYPEMVGQVPPEVVVDRMRKDIKLELQGVETSSRMATIAFTVSYSGRDPATTADVANRLASYYVEANTQSRERQAARTAEFLGQQVTTMQSELDRQERRTTDYVRRFNGELPQQIDVNMSALSRLSSALTLNAEYQVRLAERRERLEKEVADESLAAGLASDASIDEAQLTKLKQELVALRGKFSDRYPEVVRLKGEIATLEAQIASAKGGQSRRSAARRAQSDPENAARFAALDAELKQLKQEEAALRRQISGYEAKVAATPNRGREIEQLSRGRDVTRAQYETLVKQYEDARIAASLEKGNNGQQFRILDAAVPPIMPAAPQRFMLILLGAAAALAAAFVAVVIAERLDNTFHSPDELRDAVNVPILATIPQVTSSMRNKVKQVAVAGAALTGLAVIAAGSWYLAAGNEAITRLTARGGL